MATLQVATAARHTRREQMNHICNKHPCDATSARDALAADTPSRSTRSSVFATARTIYATSILTTSPPRETRWRSALSRTARAAARWRPYGPYMQRTSSRRRLCARCAGGRCPLAQHAHQLGHALARSGDPPKPRRGIRDCCDCPPQDHLAVSPPLPAPRQATNGAHEVLDRIRRRQLTLQRPRQAQSLHRERLV